MWSTMCNDGVVCPKPITTQYPSSVPVEISFLDSLEDDLGGDTVNPLMNQVQYNIICVSGGFP